MRKSGLTGDEAYALLKHGKTTEDLDPLKKELAQLKGDLGNVTNNKTGKNLFKLKDGKESFGTYFDVEFKSGLITVLKGATDYNNYLKLNTNRTVTLEKGKYTFSIQNVSNDINLGFIRLLDKGK